MAFYEGTGGEKPAAPSPAITKPNFTSRFSLITFDGFV